jgi:hypothetical protein
LIAHDRGIGLAIGVAFREGTVFDAVRSCVECATGMVSAGGES